MKRVYMITALVAALAALTACNRSGMDEAKNLIRIGSMDMSDTDAPTRGAAPNRALQPMFLFWTEGNFNSATASAPDFFVRTPEGEIDTYKTTTYKTGVYYPIQNKTIYATGFAPAPGDGYLSFATEGDYSKFIIPANPAGTYPDDEYGVMDILSAPRISATDSNPFTVANPLQFSHAQTKLFFDAKLADTMNKFVKEVKVNFPSTLVPRTLEWSASDGRYVVKGVEDGDDITLFNYWTDDGTTLSSDKRANETILHGTSSINFEHLGYTYAVPPGDHMDFTVTFKLSDTPIDPVWRDVDIPVSLDLDNTLQAGDAYRIYLVIDAYDIELSAVKVDWVDGGYISINVPITVPNP